MKGSPALFDLAPRPVVLGEAVKPLWPSNQEEWDRFAAAFALSSRAVVEPWDSAEEPMSPEDEETHF